MKWHCKLPDILKQDIPPSIQGVKVAVVDCLHVPCPSSLPIVISKATNLSVQTAAAMDTNERTASSLHWKCLAFHKSEQGL